jgi:GNAT superfamily N-acetyltransferase
LIFLIDKVGLFYLQPKVQKQRIGRTLIKKDLTQQNLLAHGIYARNLSWPPPVIRVYRTAGFGLRKIQRPHFTVMPF